VLKQISGSFTNKSIHLYDLRKIFLIVKSLTLFGPIVYWLVYIYIFDIKLRIYRVAQKDKKTRIIFKIKIAIEWFKILLVAHFKKFHNQMLYEFIIFKFEVYIKILQQEIPYSH